MVCPRGDLRQMRDREHLVRTGDVAHRISHHESRATANAGIDLVEDERRHAIESREDGLERQHHARELTA
jgi:hypothetical protein